jgi:hypothetical protein
MNWRHTTDPDTFFGTLTEPTKKLSSPLQLYEFFLDVYRQTPKERLLELIADAPHLERLKTVS